MPELPEVEVVRAGLASSVAGRTIGAVHVLHPRPVRYHLSGPDAFASDLVGRRVGVARRRGKYLWLVLAGPAGDRSALLLHLGMSGQLLVQPADAPDERHLHARFDFADDGPQLRFVDQRIFGGLWVSPQGAETPAELAHIAPDLFDPTLDNDQLVARIRARHSGIKRVLLDQGIVSGIGNIYADEALFQAGIHPQRPGDALTLADCSRLHSAIRQTLATAIREGGSTLGRSGIANYRRPNGVTGHYQQRHQVYGRTGKPCLVCGGPIHRVQVAQRSTHFCPHCQPDSRVIPSD